MPHSCPALFVGGVPKATLLTPLSSSSIFDVSNDSDMRYGVCVFCVKRSNLAVFSECVVPTQDPLCKM